MKMILMQMLGTILIILSLMCLVENRSYNNGLIFYNIENQQIYLPPTISVSRGRGLAKFKYSTRGSIWSTFGKPCDCAGPLCGCCVGMKVKQYNFDQKICANVSYAPTKDEIQLEVLLNDTSTAKYGIAARDPSPLCIPIMMRVPMSMCVQMSNVGLQGDNLNMCMDFMVRLASSSLFEMHFQCMQVGLQGASWVGPNGQPVIPPSGGKIKDTSKDEPEEYYDESAAESAENEIVSKEKEDQMNSVFIEKDENMEDENQLNKAEEEMDYNDITENIIESVNDQEKESGLMPAVQASNTINRESLEEVVKNPETVVLEDGKVSEELGISKEKPMKTNEIYEIMENNIESVKPTLIEAIETTEKDHLVDSYAEDSKETESDIVKQEINEIKDSVTEYENLNNIKDELHSENMSEENIDPIKFDSKEFMENTSDSDVQPEINFTEPIREINENTTKDQMTLMDMEMIPLTTTTEPNYNKEKTQTIEKFEMLVNINGIETTDMSKTDHGSDNSLEILQQAMETSTKYLVADNFKPTLAAAANVIATTSEIGNDSIDNALTTAAFVTSSTTTTTTTSTMKMPLLSAAENPNVTETATFNENDNDVNRNGEGEGEGDSEDNNDNNDDNHGGDNSHENDSDYDDEESEEYEDETTEKIIETNDATTTKTTATNANSISIATNVLNNDKIIESTEIKTTTITDENNIANSNESISNNDNENEEEEDDSKEIQTESDEYEDEEYEDYDTTTAAASDTITLSLSNDTHITKEEKSNSTNKAQMSHTNSNTLNVETTFSQMPQFSAIPSATATTTKTTTISSMTTAMPLPLARKIFVHHQHKQRQFQKQRHAHSHR